MSSDDRRIVGMLNALCVSQLVRHAPDAARRHHTGLLTRDEHHRFRAPHCSRRCAGACPESLRWARTWSHHARALVDRESLAGDVV